MYHGGVSSSPDPHALGTELLVTMAQFTRWAARRAPTTMPAAHLRALSQIAELEPVRIGELAKADRCSQPTMSGLVRRLEERGFVERLPDPADSRVRRVILNARGREELGAVRAAVGGTVGQTLRDLGPDALQHAAVGVEVVQRMMAADHPVVVGEESA